MDEERERSREVALKLLRLALPLLDRAGEGVAAALVRRAVESATVERPSPSMRTSVGKTKT